jgi:uncharacterized protein YqhQ
MTLPKIKLPNYGGQALIEGVLMRGQNYVAAAMRRPDGTIVTTTEKLKGIYTKGLFRVPFIRGLLLLWDSLVLGITYLTKSANEQTGEQEKIEGPTLYLTLILSLGLSIGLFFVAPAAISRWLGGSLHWRIIWVNLFEGLVRLLLILLYLWAISFMPDIKRVFRYHGAEHKTINAFEAESVLTVKQVMKFSTQHPRCGTSFLLTLVIISILVFSLIGKLSLFWTLISRIILIPVIAMVAYEYIRLMSKHLELPLMKILIWPNLKLQSMTAYEPSPDMVEVALTSFKLLLEKEAEANSEE